MTPRINSPRDTGPRRAVARLISEHQGHFTAADLLSEADAKEVRIGRATVFRTLDLLTDQGSLERIDLPTGEHAYVACEPKGHHHHVVCRDCGSSVEVDDAGLQAAVDEVGVRSGYRIDGHRLELYGLCPSCAHG